MFDVTAARVLARLMVVLPWLGAPGCIESSERRMPAVAPDANDASDTSTADIDTSTADTDTSTADTDARTCMPGHAIDESGTCAPCGAQTAHGLAVYFTFDTDSLGRDLGGAGHDGVASHLTSVPGKLGQAARFDGVTSKLALTSDTKLESSRTLCAWVSPAEALGRGGPMLVSSGNDKGPQSRVDRLGITASVATPGTCGSVTPGSAPYADTKTCVIGAGHVAPRAWTFVCYAWTEPSKTLVIYVDGAATPLSDISLVKTKLRDMTVGANPTGGASTRTYFEGDLDEVALWARALSLAEMDALYNGGEGCLIR